MSVLAEELLKLLRFANVVTTQCRRKQDVKSACSVVSATRTLKLKAIEDDTSRSQIIPIIVVFVTTILFPYANHHRY